MSLKELSDIQKQSDYHRGMIVGRKYIQEHGIEKAERDWVSHNIEDDFDAGFRKALDDYEPETLQGQDDSDDGRQDVDHRPDGS